jgi:outer membrane protein TolC
VGLDALWELDVFGGLRRGIEAANADLAASVEDLHDVLVSLIGEAGLGYVGLRSLQTRLRIAQTNLALQEETARIAEWRSEAGLVTPDSTLFAAKTFSRRMRAARRSARA